jgi:hypothetical protein
MKRAGMVAKNCPFCRYRFTPRRYFGVRSHRFPCPHCKAPLETDLRRAIAAVLVQAPVLTLAIGSAVLRPQLWWLVPPALVVAFFIHYALFSVQAVGSGSAVDQGSA